MKTLRYILAMMMSFISSTVSAETKPIMAGFGAESREDHLVDFARNGLNTQFWCVRIAPQLELEMDTEGRVITAPMDPDSLPDTSCPTSQRSYTAI